VDLVGAVYGVTRFLSTGAAGHFGGPAATGMLGAIQADVFRFSRGYARGDRLAWAAWRPTRRAAAGV